MSFTPIEQIVLGAVADGQPISPAEVVDHLSPLGEMDVSYALAVLVKDGSLAFDGDRLLRVI